MREHVLLRQAAALARCRDRRGIERVLVDEAAHGGAERPTPSGRAAASGGDRSRARHRPARRLDARRGDRRRERRRPTAVRLTARRHRRRRSRARRAVDARRRRSDARHDVADLRRSRPSGLTIRRMPPRSAGSSMLALSVSSSSSTSSSFTVSPSRFAHRTIAPFGHRLAERRNPHLERHALSSQSHRARAAVRANARFTRSASSA